MGSDNIGAIIHKRRKELNITLEKIGNACGVNKSTIMRWETGRAKDIKRSHIETLSRLLYVPIPVLLGIEDETAIESAEIVMIKSNIVNLVNSITDIDKLNNIKKYIEVFVI